MTTRPLFPAACALLAIGLSACNSSGALDPSALGRTADPTPASQGDLATRTPSGLLEGNAPAQAPAPSAAAPSGAAPVQPRQAAAIGATRLQIAPIVGASVEAAAPLTAQIQDQARRHGIALTGSGGQAATLMLKGYFSVLTEGGQATVVYVWDVYDPAGNRLHRITGQQAAPAVGGAEGWAGVAPATMQAIADTTIDQLSAWLGSRSG